MLHSVPHSTIQLPVIPTWSPGVSLRSAALSDIVNVRPLPRPAPGLPWSRNIFGNPAPEKNPDRQTLSPQGLLLPCSSCGILLPHTLFHWPLSHRLSGAAASFLKQAISGEIRWVFVSCKWSSLRWSGQRGLGKTCWKPFSMPMWGWGYLPVLRFFFVPWFWTELFLEAGNKTIRSGYRLGLTPQVWDQAQPPASVAFACASDQHR